MKQSAPLLNGTDNAEISSGEKHAVMEEQPGNIQLLIDRAGDYLETRLELLKLKATQKSSDVVSSIASTVIMVSIMIMFFIILNIGLALLIGELLGKSYYGFFALAGFYLLAGLIFSAFKNKWVKEPVTNSIIKKVYN